MRPLSSHYAESPINGRSTLGRRLAIRSFIESKFGRQPTTLTQNLLRWGWRDRLALLLLMGILAVSSIVIFDAGAYHCGLPHKRGRGADVHPMPVAANIGIGKPSVGNHPSLFGQSRPELRRHKYRWNKVRPSRLFSAGKHCRIYQVGSVSVIEFHSLPVCDQPAHKISINSLGDGFAYILYGKIVNEQLSVTHLLWFVRKQNRYPGTLVEPKVAVSVAPLQVADTGVYSSSAESHPCRPSKRILYAIMAIISSLSFSFRLLVLGKNWVEPDWLNIPSLLAAFLLGAYGVYVFLDLSEGRPEQSHIAVQFAFIHAGFAFRKGGALMTCLSSLWKRRYSVVFVMSGFLSSALSWLWGAGICFTPSPGRRSAACRRLIQAPFQTAHDPSGDVRYSGRFVHQGI